MCNLHLYLFMEIVESYSENINQKNSLKMAAAKRDEERFLRFPEKTRLPNE